MGRRRAILAHFFRARLPYVVILNEVKNLEVSVTVVGSTSLEILRYTQDDIESVRLPRLVPSLAMTIGRARG